VSACSRRWFTTAIFGSIGLGAVFVLLKLSPPIGNSYERHFFESLPPSARLLHSHRDGGIDVQYAFVFAVADDQLRDRFIERWRLRPVQSVDHGNLIASATEATSFVELDPPAWWPADRLEKLPDKYARTGWDAERYWTIWADRENGRLYAEYGGW